MPTSLPYGMRDLKITPYTDAGGTTLATESIDLPNIRSLSFTEAEEFQELRGDDTVVTTRGNGASVEWETESGGLSLEAVKAMYGGTITTSGVAPATKTTWKKKATDSRPFFKIEGQAISDSGGDVHSVIFRARCTDNFSGEFKDGEFFLTKAKGKGLPILGGPNAGDLYEFVQNDSAAVSIP